MAIIHLNQKRWQMFNFMLEYLVNLILWQGRRFSGKHELPPRMIFQVIKKEGEKEEKEEKEKEECEEREAWGLTQS